jgi:hypothetical protein
MQSILKLRQHCSSSDTQETLASTPSYFQWEDHSVTYLCEMLWANVEGSCFHRLENWL